VHSVERQRHADTISRRLQFDDCGHIVGVDAWDEISQVDVRQPAQRLDLGERDAGFLRERMPAFFKNSIWGGSMAVIA
jgi:hypothetical protein